MAALIRLTAQDGWSEFRSYEGRFRIQAPGPMQQKTDTISTRLGPTAYHTFFYQTEGGDNLLYMVSYCDYPEGGMHADSTELIEPFFEATVEAAAFSIDGKVVYSSPMKFFNYPGYIWRIDYLEGQAVVKTRAFIIEQRYYAIQTVTYRGLNLNPHTDRFMDSFRLLTGPD